VSRTRIAHAYAPAALLAALLLAVGAACHLDRALADGTKLGPVASSASGWIDNGTTVTQSTPGDGVGINATPDASTIFHVTGVFGGARTGIYLSGGQGAAAATGGLVAIDAGGGGAGAAGGTLRLKGGVGGTGASAGGPVEITGGTADTTGLGGSVVIAGGTGASATGGAVTITGGAAAGVDHAGGAVTITAGARTGTGTQGRVKLVDGSTALFTFGTGTPEAAVAAPIGSLFLRDDGGPGTAAYMKLSGAGNTGWGTLASITPWAAAAVTCNWTNQATTSLMRRVGDVAEYQILVTCSGAPGAASLILTLDQTVDETKTLAGSLPCGTGYINDSGTVRGILMPVYADSSDTVTAFILTTSPSTLTNVSNTVPVTMGASDTVVLSVVVPITGW
jgi:hypothetical protein